MGEKLLCRRKLQVIVLAMRSKSKETCHAAGKIENNGTLDGSDRLGRGAGAFCTSAATQSTLQWAPSSARKQLGEGQIPTSTVSQVEYFRPPHSGVLSFTSVNGVKIRTARTFGPQASSLKFSGLWLT